MTPKQKILWLEALRSGKYRQGKQALKTKSAKGQYSYCCLGVAKEVCAIKNSEKIIHGSFLFITGEAVFLSIFVQEILANKNDKGTSFTKIADYIEKNFRPDEEEYLP